MNYELLVIGNGREAIDSATSTARQGRFVALVQPINVTRASITVATLRQAAKQLLSKGPVQLSELRRVATQISEQERAIDQAQLEQLGVDVFCGNAHFIDDKTIEVDSSERASCDSTPNAGIIRHDSQARSRISAAEILLACGSRPIRPSHIPFNNRTIVDSETLLTLPEFPSSMIVVGAGTTGLDYALFLASLGIDVTVVDEQAGPIDLYRGFNETTKLDDLSSLDIAFRLGDEVIGIDSRNENGAAVRLASGKIFSAGAVLMCIGRCGETTSLNLDVTGVGLDERGRIWCDANGRTWVDHINAAGDVVGFRARSLLAS